MKRKVWKAVAICVGLIFLFVLLGKLFWIPAPLPSLDNLDSYSNEHCFYATRNGIIYDSHRINDRGFRDFFTSSLDQAELLPVMEGPTAIDRLRVHDVELDGSPSGMLSKDYSGVAGFSIITYDKATQAPVARRHLFNFRDDETRAKLVCNYSKRLLLFRELDIVKNDEGSRDKEVLDYFWYVLQDGEWVRRPFECGLTGAYISCWETIPDLDLIFLLMYSAEGDAWYLVKYDCHAMRSLYKVRLAPPRPGKGYRQFRLLTGEQNLFVYQQFIEGEQVKIKIDVFSTSDFSHVADFVVPVGQQQGYREEVIKRNVLLSPDLRYLAYERYDGSLYVHDVTQGKTTKLRKAFSFSWRGYWWHFPTEVAKNSMNLYYAACVFTMAFSADSQTLYDANQLGDLFLWDMKSKKLRRRVTGVQ